jgi:hypothetical protein
MSARVNQYHARLKMSHLIATVLLARLTLRGKSLRTENPLEGLARVCHRLGAPVLLLRGCLEIQSAVRNHAYQPQGICHQGCVMTGVPISAHS